MFTCLCDGYVRDASSGTTLSVYRTEYGFVQNMDSVCLSVFLSVCLSVCLFEKKQRSSARPGDVGWYPCHRKVKCMSDDDAPFV